MGFCLRGKNHCPRAEFLVLWGDFMHWLWGLGVKALISSWWLALNDSGGICPSPTLSFSPSSSVPPWSYPAFKWANPRPSSGKTQVLGTTILGPGDLWLVWRVQDHRSRPPNPPPRFLLTPSRDIDCMLKGKQQRYNLKSRQKKKKQAERKRHRRLVTGFSNETMEAKDNKVVSSKPWKRITTTPKSMEAQISFQNKEEKIYF